MNDTRNIADRYKGWEEDLIRKDLNTNSFNYAVMMEHWQGDFNMGTLIRNANGCGAREVFYVGRRRWDKRGAVGTYLYTNLTYLESLEQVEALKPRYTLVGIDNVPGAVSIDDYDWDAYDDWRTPVMMVFGEEGTGLTPEMQSLCSAIVEIPMYGSVRSFNCGTSSGMVMRDYITKFQSRCTHQYHEGNCLRCKKRLP